MFLMKENKTKKNKFIKEPSIVSIITLSDTYS